MESKYNTLTIGIDFGTTNTVISFYKKNPEIFKDSIKDTIPTKIFFDTKISCGNYIPIELDGNSKMILSNFKTKIGSGFEFDYNNKTLTDIDIITIFFNHLKELLDTRFPDTVFNSVLTVPSNFNDNQRKLLMSIAENVGFKVLRLINEPTAAAFAYGLNNMEECKILVVDIGGGTLDMTLLEIDDNFFETIDSVGVNDLGGNDFTNAIYNDCLSEFKTKYKVINKDLLISQTKLIQLLYKCNKAKEKLSWVDSCQIEIKNFYTNITEIDGIITNKSVPLVYNLDKQKFKIISKNILDRIRRKLTPFKKDLNIDKLILVGGTSKLEVVQELLSNELGLDPIIHNQLHNVVALGACYYGAFIQGELSNDDIILVDNLPLSLGIETAEGNFSIIIPKNTPLPVTRSQKYTIDTPGEEEVIIKVYQGERTIATNNFLMGEFVFNKISKVGVPIINITFKVDINGLINISIEDKHSGHSNDILIRNINQNIKNIDDIIKEANDFKEIDEQSRVKAHLFYKIEIRIETILNNIKNNNLIAKSKKDDTINYLLSELDTLREKSIQELIKLDQKIDEEYFTVLQSGNIEEKPDFFNNKLDDNIELNIEEIIKKEKLEFLQNKIDFYMTKNITDFQRECLNKITDLLMNGTINNIDIDEKIEYIKELFKENDKDELVQLCLFLKEELENHNLDINEKQSAMLSKIVSKYLEMMNNTCNNTKNSINYKEEIINLNKLCEDIMKNNV
jgi:molecular chaperone DnaK